MTDIRGDGAKDGSRRRRLSWIVWGAAAIGLAVVVYVIATVVIKPGHAPDLKSAAKGDMGQLVLTGAGHPPPTTPILDASDQATDLTRLTGKVMVVNLWATWCGPCVKEMPTLAALQSAYPGRIRVVPVSIDVAKDREKARGFMAKYPSLPFYQDPASKLEFALDPPVEGTPTTILYGADGRERARLSGDADWSGPNARAVIEALLAEK